MRAMPRKIAASSLRLRSTTKAPAKLIFSGAAPQKTRDPGFRRDDSKEDSSREPTHLLQASRKLAFGDLEIVVGLQVQPELRTLTEGATETQSKFSGDGTLLANDVRDTHRRNADGARKSRLAHAPIVQDFFQKLAWMYGRHAVLGGGDGHDSDSSMVVDDLDLEGMTVFKTKTQPPLVVDADAPLACAVTAQGFEVIGPRLTQIFRVRGQMQKLQPTQRSSHDALRKPPRGCSGKQPLRFLVGEAPDHFDNINRLFTTGKSLELAV
jgi:hypothetical protein